MIRGENDRTVVDTKQGKVPGLPSCRQRCGAAQPEELEEEGPFMAGCWLLAKQEPEM